jgi:hypothetical protein
MRVKLLIIVALLLVNQATYASGNQKNNPFLPPSERIVQEIAPPPPPVCQKSDSETASAEALTALLEKEMAASKNNLNNEPDLPPGAYKDWTKEDVQKSRFIGQINNFRVYFHNEKQVFFNLEINKAKLLDGTK